MKRGGSRQYQLNKLLCTAASWGNSLKTLAQETHKILWEGAGLQPSTSPSRHSTASSLLGRGWRNTSSRWEPRTGPAPDILLLAGLLVNRTNLSPLWAQENRVVGKSCYWVASFPPTKRVGLGPNWRNHIFLRKFHVVKFSSSQMEGTGVIFYKGSGLGLQEAVLCWLLDFIPVLILLSGVITAISALYLF